MKTNKIFLGFLMCSAIGLTTSCLSETKDLEPRSVPEEKETGRLVLDLNADANFNFETRAVDENTYKNTDGYTVNITGSAGNVFSGTFAQFKAQNPTSMELDNGSYDITASYGTEMPASRDVFLSTGNATFTIRGDQITTANVECTPTAGKIQVVFDASMETYCASYSVKFGGTSALGSNTVKWNKGESAPYYLAIGENGETVNYTINVTAKPDFAPVVNGEKVTVANVQGSFSLARNHTKKLTIKPNYTPTTDGGLNLEITIDDSTNDQEINIEVPLDWI